MKTLLGLAMAGTIIGWAIVAYQIRDFKNSSPIERHYNVYYQWPLIMALTCSVVMGSLL